jgi:hypothetical protein
MICYRVCDLRLASNVPLPELLRADADAADCVFELLPARAASRSPDEWLQQWQLPAGQVWLSLARDEAGFLLRFPDLADFLVTVDGKEVRCCPAPGIPAQTIRHLLLDQVLPLVLSQRGSLVLHASAVVTAKGAIAFAGATGRGKSTLATSFSVHHGFPLLADDCLLLHERAGQIISTPSYPGVRLWGDAVATLFEAELVLADVAHYSAKKRLTPDMSRLPFHTDPIPLRRMYFLDPSAEKDRGAIVIDRLSPLESFMELVAYAFKLDIADQALLRREFDSFSRVAALPLSYRLAFPHDFTRLADVRAAIVAHLDAVYPDRL